MLSARYLGKHAVEVRDVDMPVCGDDDILVRNICSSICGTDVAVFEHGPATGHRITPEGEFGHETVSRVIEAGRNVEGIKVGDRIYPYPLFAKDDTSRAGTLGGFSECMLLPNVRLGHSCYLVDERISDHAACMIEPFTVGGRAAKQVRPRPHETAVVFGCGTIGIASAIMLAHLGLTDILIADRSDFRLAHAAHLGFATCSVAQEDVIQKARTLFGTAPSLRGETAHIDIWIDAAGADAVLDSFLATGQIGSRLVMVAVNNARRDLSLLDLTYASQSLIGSGGYRPEDVPDVMEIMASGKWDIESIVTQRFALEDISQALACAGDADHAFNVQIDFPDR